MFHQNAGLNFLTRDQKRMKDSKPKSSPNGKFNTNSTNNGNCRNPECNLKETSRHVPSECWIKFPDKRPERMRDSKPKSSPKEKLKH